MNREQWLERAVEILAEDVFLPAGYTVPAVRVSVGFPGGGSKRTRIGECWTERCAEDGVCQIFISPLLGNETTVVATLAHELVHATVGVDKGHKRPFKACATLIGLEGKMTATVPGQRLTLWICGSFATKIGERYPHAKLTMGAKKQSTRMLKCVCGDCGYVARTTAKWIEAVGAPLCACNGEPMEVANV